MFEAGLQAKEPVKAFLMKNSHVKDRVMFYRMAVRLRKPEDQKGVGPEDFLVIVPSFVISELKEAFQIGFIIFVPFLVIATGVLMLVTYFEPMTLWLPNLVSSR